MQNYKFKIININKVNGIDQVLFKLGKKFSADQWLLALV